jgi:phospholipase A1
MKACFVASSAHPSGASSARITLLALQFFLACSANASVNNDSLKTCLEMQGTAPSDQALECYNRVAQEQLAQGMAEKHPEPHVKERSRSLAAEWTPSDELLRVYKQNYFLVYSHSSRPNDTPTSPNPDNQVAASYPLDNKEMKFQISIKGHMLGEKRHTLWFGYTQLSFYQIYDGAHSNPFRESNYEPELIYSYRPESPVPRGVMNASMLNVGFVHQSNGQTLPRSRSWNRLYIQVGLEKDFGDNGKLALLPRWWKRIGGGTSDDDNPDITSYLGHGDLEARYYKGKLVLSALARRRSLQIDLAFQTPELLGIQIKNSNLHLQLFDGYGESLIDYNQRHHTIGFGISLPFE